MQVLPGAAVGRLHQPLDLAQVEQSDLGGLGEQRIPQLLGVAVDVTQAVGVHPAAAIAHRADIIV